METVPSSSTKMAASSLRTKAKKAIVLTASVVVGDEKFGPSREGGQKQLNEINGSVIDLIGLKVSI